MSRKDEIERTVKSYILEEFLPDEDPEALEDSTPLISGGILDSISTIKLVTFLEQEYEIEFSPHEISVDCLNTLSGISTFIQEKLSLAGD